MARVSLQEYCEESSDLINAHAYDDAIAICRHILKRYPKHIRAYQILGEACLEKGEIEEAIDIFKRLLNHADPENFVAY
ncbi:MAG: tetratricopeptide repeat protein, partial [Chloroflexi bacterium]|nr:tetratricopeptide repeat protein [Chloroflexota bacterium]